jgi:hypothetical protein
MACITSRELTLLKLTPLGLPLDCRGSYMELNVSTTHSISKSSIPTTIAADDLLHTQQPTHCLHI